KVKARRDSDSVNINPKRMKLEDEDDLDKENDSIVTSDVSLENVSQQLLSLEQNLVIEVGKITFRSPVEYVYNPLEYAFNIHTMYVEKYCKTAKKILFLGMNPGPWGMVQTGVPFGEINMVRDWLKISGPVGKPAKEQPSRKVTGFQCTRSEVSGKRLWGLFQELCKSPEKFFKHAYGPEVETLHAACDKALEKIINILKVGIVIGIGGYAGKRAQLVVQASKLPVKVLCLPHPSPRAVNNKNWSEKATQKLSEFGLLKYFTV
ncbi:unnamed protein product, partial [Heterotrigona itama]